MDIDGEEVIFHIFDTAGKVCPIVCEKPWFVSRNRPGADPRFFSGGTPLRNYFNVFCFCLFFFVLFWFCFAFFQPEKISSMILAAGHLRGVRTPAPLHLLPWAEEFLVVRTYLWFLKGTYCEKTDRQ